MLAFYELVLVTAVFHLLTLGMEVWAGTFFDDFPILSKSASAESLRGRLIWFEGFLFGRIVSLSLHEIGKRATALGHGHQLNDSLRMALVFFRDRIVNGRPIEITKAVGRTVSIFTDGAFEPTSQNPGTFGRHHLQ